MALPTRHFKLGFNSFFIFGVTFLPELENYDIIGGLLNFVVRGMKFSYDFVIDESDGKQLTNGTWTGIKGLLNRSEIDYAPARLMMKEEEYDVMAYNYPYASDELVFVTRKPEYSPEIMAQFRTLSLNVWLSLLASIILVTLACFVAMKNRCNLRDILLHVLAICLNQEGNLVAQRAGEVLLLCTWTVAMAVFTLCFKSVLLSFLTFPPLGFVRTVPELAAAIRAGECSAFTYYDNDFARYLQRSPNEDYRVIGESMLKNPYGVLEEVIDQSNKYPSKVFVYTRSEVSFAEGNYFYISKDNMGILYFATAVSTDFCCKDEMDMLILRFLAAGIDQKIDRFRNHMATFVYMAGDANVYADGSEKAIRKLTMTDISGALTVLVAGHCLSVVVIFIERMAKRRETRHSSMRTK